MQTCEPHTSARTCVRLRPFEHTTQYSYNISGSCDACIACRNPNMAERVEDERKRNIISLSQNDRYWYSERWSPKKKQHQIKYQLLMAKGASKNTASRIKLSQHFGFFLVEEQQSSNNNLDDCNAGRTIDLQHCCGYRGPIAG